MLNPNPRTTVIKVDALAIRNREIFLFRCLYIAYFFNIVAFLFAHQPGSKLPLCTAAMVCRWNLGTRPPIRISDIPSWTYDKNTYSENPARSEGPWKKSKTDFTIINKLSGWICWYNEINSSPDILGCCVFESWLYCKFEHNPAILRDVFGEMLQQAPYFGRCVHEDRISVEWWKYTPECRVATMHRKPLQMHNHERQNRLQTRFWCQDTKPSRSSMQPANVVFCTSAKKVHHQIWNFVDASKCMIGK